MFWSDWGTVPKIERSGMDGSYRQVILKDKVRWPNGLTVDLALDKLYWVDAKLNTIGSSNLDGSGARTVLFSTQHLRHPFSISVFSDLMYWTEWDTHAIYQANKFTGTNITAITTTGSVSATITYLVSHHTMFWCRTNCRWWCRCTIPTDSQTIPTTAYHSMVTAHTSVYPLLT